MKVRIYFFIIIMSLILFSGHGSYSQNLSLSPISENNVGDSLNVRLVGRWANGPCFAVMIVKNMAYFGNGSCFEIVDFSKPDQPLELSKLILPSVVRGIKIIGSYAYIADDLAGLRIIDISNPYRPNEIGFHDTPGRASGLDVSGIFVYLADGEKGIRIIDVSNPFQPKEIGSYDTNNLAVNVAVKGNYLYVADEKGGLRIIDSSNPTAPVEIGYFVTASDAMNVAVSSNYAYVAAGSGGLRVIDVSNPYKPAEIGYYDTNGIATGIAVSGSYVDIADGLDGLRIIDVSNPYKPNEIGFYDTFGYAYDVSLSETYVYLADGTNGLRMIDASNPFQPVELGHFDTDGHSRGVAVRGSYAYLANGEAGLRIIDISDPARPAKVGSLNLAGFAEDIAVNSNYAFIANHDNGLRIIDIADPSQPNEVGFIKQNVYAHRVVLRGNYAYVADWTTGLKIIDVTNPFQPILVGSFTVPDARADDLAIKGNYLYLAAGNDGLRIFDISDPKNPIEVSFHDTNGFAVSVDVDENYAYVGTDQNDIRIIDIRSPTQPIDIASYQLSNPLYKLMATARYIYGANAGNGLRILDVFNPSNIVLSGYYQTGSLAYDVAMDGKYIYLADDSDGLYILEFLGTSSNVAPYAPTLVSPVNHSYLSDDTPQLIWQIPRDENGDLLHFNVELDIDGDWNIIDYMINSKSDTAGFSPAPPVKQGSGSMSYTLPSPLAESDWYWRVSAWDGLAYSEFSDIWHFTVDTTKPVIKNLIFENPGYSWNWFDQRDDTSVTLLVLYDELHPAKSTLSGSILSDTLTVLNLSGGYSQEVRFNFSITNQSDGIYPIIVTIQDSAGNMAKQEGSINLDSTPPAGYYSDAPDTIMANQNFVVHVLGAIDGNGSGVAQIYLDVFKSADREPITVQDSLIGITEPGIYYYRYFAIDYLGNRGEIKTDTTVVIPVYAPAPILLRPESNKIVAGMDFRIDVKVGNDQEQVQNLFAVSLVLNYTNTEFIDIDSTDGMALGDLLGQDVVFSTSIADEKGRIAIGISRKPGAGGIKGYGTLVGIHYTSAPNTPDCTLVHFTLTDITASDPDGNPIKLIPQDTTVWIIQPLSDFTMTAMPDSQTVYPGDSTTFAISFQPLGKFDSQVSLEISGLPDGMNAAYPTQPFAIPRTLPITFATFSDLATGIYTPIINGTGGGKTHWDTLTINVIPRPDFIMTVVPDTQTIYPGESTEFALSFQPIGGFKSKINLQVSNLPSGMEAQYPTDAFAIPDSFHIKFSTIADILPGTYQPIVLATGAGITHQDTVIIQVLPVPPLPDFIMSIRPDSQTIRQGESTEVSLSFQPIGEFNAQLSLQVSNLPTGMEAIFSSEPFAIPASFNITFKTSIDLLPGSYEPVITATGGGISHYVTTIIRVLPLPDFIMTIQPDSQSVMAGRTIAFEISFEPVGGFNAQIVLNVSNVPEGIEAEYTTQPFDIPIDFNIKFRVANNVPPDVYYPTVTATGGGVTHQKTLIINVVPDPVDLLSQGYMALPNPFTPNGDGFNDYVEFHFPESIGGNVIIFIFDIDGRKIIEIRNEKFWYGKDDNGRIVKPGAYIYMIKNGEKVVSKGVINVAL